MERIEAEPDLVRTLSFSTPSEARAAVHSRESTPDFVVSRRELFPRIGITMPLFICMAAYGAFAIVRRLETGRWGSIWSDHDATFTGWLVGLMGAAIVLPLGLAVWYSNSGVRISRRQGVVGHGGKSLPLSALSLARVGSYEQEPTPDRDAMLWFFIGVRSGDEDVKLCETTRGTRIYARLHEIASELNEAIFWQQRYEAAQAYLREHSESEGSPYRAAGSKGAP